MNNQTKLLIGVIIFAAFLTAAIFAYKALSTVYKPESALDITTEEATDIPEADQQAQLTAAPDFVAYDADGNAVKLSDYFGMPIVLNFWASWCPPCKSEMPHFNKVSQELQDEVLFLMVDMVDGQRETVEKGKAYVEENGFTFPVLFDSDSSGAYTYGVRSIPTTLFLDKDGNIVTGVAGAMDEATLLKGIELIHPTEEEVTPKGVYQKITAEQAKARLEENPDAILLDVRTEQEYNQAHIEGALLIPDYELKEKAAQLLPALDAEILIYCRSGNRSKTAANLLLDLGYTNVSDFGGLNTWPYDTVK